MNAAVLYVTCWIMGRYVALISSQKLTKDNSCNKGKNFCSVLQKKTGVMSQHSI